MNYFTRKKNRKSLIFILNLISHHAINKTLRFIQLSSDTSWRFENTFYKNAIKFDHLRCQFFGKFFKCYVTENGIDVQKNFNILTFQIAALTLEADKICFTLNSLIEANYDSYETCNDSISFRSVKYRRVIMSKTVYRPSHFDKHRTNLNEYGVKCLAIECPEMLSILDKMSRKCIEKELLYKFFRNTTDFIFVNYVIN